MSSGKEYEHPATEGPGPRPYVLRVTGDMDFDHAAQLAESLRNALGRAPSGAEIVVDLRNSSFCDSAGLSVLLAARERARNVGHDLVLAAPSHQMVRVLELTGADGLFPLRAAVPDRPRPEN
ncbi:STAS domain-containing protein [Streptomyces bambusae]|uniref:STAS domain-containing protein n=1 Tax=Streptomyces bambusae TaxID=1550616 RepID=UPI001CFEE9C0|nr:STAS domain-containing protein [Streptomyces bambusae]MCB5166495.1 STAS domain-containing protein [Streptomyces bambusae]